jgi:hypothetical protein
MRSIGFPQAEPVLGTPPASTFLGRHRLAGVPQDPPDLCVCDTAVGQGPASGRPGGRATVTAATGAPGHAAAEPGRQGAGRRDAGRVASRESAAHSPRMACARSCLGRRGIGLPPGARGLCGPSSVFDRSSTRPPRPRRPAGSAARGASAAPAPPAPAAPSRRGSPQAGRPARMDGGCPSTRG